MPDVPQRFPSARDIEKIARNPECETLRSALAGNVDLAKYAVELGLKEEVQSPLALARGNQVERFTLGNNAARLVEKLIEDGKIQANPSVADLGKRQPNRAGMGRAAARTDSYLADLIEGRPTPDLLIHPVLSIALGPDTQFIEPDSLVLYQGALTFEPLELKSYPFRFGKTDKDDLRQARRQGAVYVYALKKRIGLLGGPEVSVPARVTLVFTRPDSLYPSPIYHESVAGEMRDAEQAVALLERSKIELEELVPKGMDVRDVLPTLQIHYTEECLSFCALSKRCREATSATGNLAVLGERSAKVLGSIANVDRAVELLEGAEPGSEGERVVAQRLRSVAAAIGEFKVAR